MGAVIAHSADTLRKRQTLPTRVVVILCIVILTMLAVAVVTIIRKIRKGRAERAMILATAAVHGHA